MLDKCPCCERDFKSLEDFPLIYLHNFERLNIPIDSVFPFEDGNIFVDHTSDAGNKKAPEEVVKFFSDNLTEGIFYYEGWKWEIKRQSRENFYHRMQVNQKDIIMNKINPYLDRLESLVSKEVGLKEMLPDFNKNNYFRFAFDIPDTDYNLALNEEESSNYFRNSKILILGNGINLGSAGGPTLTTLCEIGKLTYKGRVKLI